MKIRTKLIIPAASLVIIAALMVIIFSNRTVSNLSRENESVFLNYTQDVLEHQAADQQANLQSSIAAVGHRALEMASIFSEVPDVQTAYRLTGLGDQNDEANRELRMARNHLREFIKPYVEGYKRNTGNKQLKVHFHTITGRSLARLWRDGWQVKRNGEKLDISDDLSSFRKSVVDINDAKGDHKPISGIEIGRGGFAIRGLVPISSPDGKHVGSVEVLLPFSDAIETNRDTDGTYEIAVYMLAENLSTATRLQDPKKNPVLDNKYVFISSTDPETTNRVMSSDLLDAGLSKLFQKTVDDKYISTAPIYDYSHKVAGVMALVYDMTQINAVQTGMTESATNNIRTVSWKFGLGGLVMVMVIVGFLIFVTRKVTDPMEKTVSVAQKIARGDLSETVGIRSSDEIGELSDAMDKMVESLRIKAREARQIADGNLKVKVEVASEQDVMGQAFRTMVANMNEVLSQVDQAAFQIDSDSNQVSDSAQSLSQGATESAASLEEISSSMNEINTQTLQSAENAEQANKLANGAQDAARSGNQQMGAMVAAMGEINVASQNISKIIKVIDEIAFQTNLLALNAAVEAARAGQHGKGFAVVAEEVRNLAARSAKAAEETAELIEGSVQKAVNGSQIARKTSESLEEIVTSITKVTDLVAEIATASHEQAQGISQINQGLGQIDATVQQSTATAEETAAASEQLSSQSAYLKQLLGRFNLERSPQQAIAPTKLTRASHTSLQTPSEGWDNIPAQSASTQNIALDDEEFGKY